MTTHEDLANQYHQQDTDYYCAAACAQMVLEQCGAGLLDQDDLYNDNHSHSTAEANWYTAPDGLQWTLNNRQSGKYFVLDALSSEDALSRMLAWTIHHYRVSPVAMVYGSAHWIVVRGYTASATPSSSSDVSYTLSGFDVNNPWPPTPTPGSPPPHTAADVCGSGGDRGVADEHISYATWQSTYMTGVPGGRWGGKFVAVCDPEPPPTRRPERQERPKPLFDGAQLIEGSAARDLSLRGVEEAGLLTREQWERAFDGVTPGEPVLVQRLDHLDSFYWIVPQTRNGVVTAAVNVDARTGLYMQSRALSRHEGQALLTLSRDDVQKLIYDRPHQLAGEAGRLRLRPDIACVSREWVWRPCWESLSPFYPFKLVSYGAHRLYLRSDGAVFTSLTLTGRGI